MCATVLPGQLLFQQPIKKAPRTLWDPHVHYLLHNTSTTCPSAEPHQSTPTPHFVLKILFNTALPSTPRSSSLFLAVPTSTLDQPIPPSKLSQEQQPCPFPVSHLLASQPEALSSHIHFRCGGMLSAGGAHSCHGLVTDRTSFNPRQASSCGICGRQSGTETSSPPSSFDFPFVSIITQHSVLNFMLVQLLLGQAGEGREI